MADIIPDVERLTYIKARNSVNEVKRSAKAKAALYADALAQAVLRCLYEVYQADVEQHIQSAVLNAHVETIDPGTGS
jgi:hypothetical protein